MCRVQNAANQNAAKCIVESIVETTSGKALNVMKLYEDLFALLL
jgi:hypothetical protein